MQHRKIMIRSPHNLPPHESGVTPDCDDVAATLAAPRGGPRSACAWRDIRLEGLECRGARDKSRPYYSDKRDPTINHNGAFPYPDAARGLDGDGVYVCRQLAHAWFQEAMQAAQRGTKVDYGRFSSQEAVAAMIPDPDSHRGTFRPQDATFVASRRFGEFLQRHFGVMKARSINHDQLLIETHNHTMAADLEIRPGDSGKGPSCVVRFYEPNATLTHARAEVFDLSSLGKLCLQEFYSFAPEYLADEHAAVSVQSGAGLRCTGLAVDGEAGFVRMLPSWVHHALRTGNADEVREIAAELERTRGQEPQILPPLGAAALGGVQAGESGLYHALADGNHEAIRAYGQLIRAAGLTDAAALGELLAATDPDGTPGLYLALAQGHARAIEAFGGLVKDVGANDTDTLGALLAARDADGTPGLHYAITKGHADAVRAFGALLEDSGLPDGACATLLQPPQSLHIALADSRTGAVRAYCDVLRRLAARFDPATKRDFLEYLRSAQTKTGTPGRTGLLSGFFQNMAQYQAMKRRDPDLYRLYKQTKAAMKT